MWASVILICIVSTSEVLSNHLPICSSGYSWWDTTIGPQTPHTGYTTDPGQTQNIAYFRENEVQCCGVVNDMEATIERSGTLVLHVWRPDGTGNYELVGTTSTQCDASNNKCSETFSGTERIVVKDNDQIGWWCSTTELVRSGFSFGINTVREKTLASPTVGDVINWSTATTTTTNLEYALTIRLTANTAPVLDGLPTTKTVAENEAVGTSVYAVTATDTDANDVLTLDLQMTSNNYFSFNETTKEVRVKAGLGQAPSPQYLSFTVYDQCHNSDTGILTVNIINEPPVIYNLPNSTSLHENTDTETSLYTVHVNDTFDTFTCSITSVSPSSGCFQVRQQSTTEWEIITVTGCSFDYDVTTYHRLTITCDDGDDTTSGQFVLNLTPNAQPVIHNLPNSTDVHEDTSSSNEVLLYSLDVTDADSPSVSCQLGTGSTGGAATKFRVRQITGSSVWGIYTKSGAVFDYNTVSEFDLDIECEDDRDLVHGTFTVYLQKNQPPEVTNLPNRVNMSTNAPIGYTVFQTTASDVENDQLTYYVTCSTSSCPFVIFGAGNIQLTTDLSGITDLVGYDIYVTVGDHRNNGTTRTLTVSFIDINDIPEITKLDTTVNVPENNVLGDVITSAVCVDFDPDDSLKFSMSCSPSVASGYFQIDPSNGDVTTSGNVINYESLSQSTFLCYVTCSDGVADDVRQFTIIVNDVNESPLFTQPAFSIIADEGAAGSIIQSAPFPVLDPDDPDTQSFFLDCGSYTSFFTVVTGTGVTSFTSQYDVDSGTRPTSLTCTLTVTDSGGLSDTAIVDITINNINDNLPTFASASYSFFLSYYAPVSTSFGDVQATDNDVGVLGQVTYRLDQNTLGASYFGVTQDGILYVQTDIKPLGHGSTVTIEVVATDGGGEESRVPVTVVISSTTTTSTTTTTDRYQTFLEDSSNITWLVFAAVGVVTCVAVSFYMGFRFFGRSPPSLTRPICKCCRVEKVSVRPKRSWSPQKQAVPRDQPPRLFDFWSTNNYC